MGEYKTVSFDGISGAGKSTMAAMLKEVSVDAVILSEKELNPYTTATECLERLFQVRTVGESLALLVEDFPNMEGPMKDANAYAQQFFPRVSKTAVLSYLIEFGNYTVEKEHLQEATAEGDVILDPGHMTDWASRANLYYPWQERQRLAAYFGTHGPDIQFIITSSIKDAINRRQLQDPKTPIRTTFSQEERTINALQAIYRGVYTAGNIYQINNHGAATGEISDQINQAREPFSYVTDLLEIRGFGLRTRGTSDPSFWADPDRLDRIKHFQQG